MKIIDGKELIISPAPFEDAMALQEVIAKAFKKDGIKIDLSSVELDFENLEKIKSGDIGDIGWIVEPVLTMLTDSTIRKHLFKCAERGLFNKLKIDENLFDAPENRKYYHQVMMEVLKVNISPFFDRVSSQLSSLPGLTELVQKLKSPPQK